MDGELNIFSNPIYDFEFLGFSFDGRHSSEFGLTVVSPSDRTQENMFAGFEDKTISVSGRDGAYYFGTEIRTKDLSLTVAFDRLTSAQYRNIITWLNPKIVGKLVFDEKPYKYYWVKISSQPTFSFIPFEEEFQGEKLHVFKGDLVITFIAHDPYGYADSSLLEDVSIWDGLNQEYFKPYIPGNIPGWYLESGLFDGDEVGLVNGSGSILDYSTIGVIQKDSTNANFYNCGTIETPINFTFEIAAFPTDAAELVILNVTTGKSFKLKSLKNITGLETNIGPWTIVCNPTIGQLTSTIGGVKYNLGPIHNGEFLKLEPGNNYLSINKVLNSFSYSFKNKYW